MGELAIEWRARGRDFGAGTSLLRTVGTPARSRYRTCDPLHIRSDCKPIMMRGTLHGLMRGMAVGLKCALRKFTGI